MNSKVTYALILAVAVASSPFVLAQQSVDTAFSVPSSIPVSLDSGLGEVSGLTATVPQTIPVVIEAKPTNVPEGFEQIGIPEVTNVESSTVSSVREGAYWNNVETTTKQTIKTTRYAPAGELSGGLPAPIPNATVMQVASETADYFDTNGDGMYDTGEVLIAFKNLVTESELLDSFPGMSEDFKNDIRLMIGSEEFGRAMLSHGKVISKKELLNKVEEFIQSFDYDRDGKMSGSEFIEAALVLTGRMGYSLDTDGLGLGPWLKDMRHKFPPVQKSNAQKTVVNVPVVVGSQVTSTPKLQQLRSAKN